MSELINTIINAILNSPIEAIFIAGFSIFIYKFFRSNEKLWYMNRRHMKRNILHSIRKTQHFINKIINNRQYSFCRLEVDNLDKVYSIIKTRPAFNWRQRDIIHEETGLSYPEIAQLIHALNKLGKIEWDKDYRLVVCNVETN